MPHAPHALLGVRKWRGHGLARGRQPAVTSVKPDRAVNDRRPPADTSSVRDWLYSYRCGAGRQARVKYRTASGRWRKRVFRHPWSILAVLAGATVLVAALEDHSRWPLILGFLLGALLTGYIAVLESPPAHIENWRTGSEGERRTARVLAPLRQRGCVLLHDLPDRRTREYDHPGNIDHIVVFDGGIFLLDSKQLGGEASVDGDNIHVQRRDDDENAYDLPRLARAMRGRALRLQQDLSQQTGVTFVQPVVVFWNPFPAGVATGENIAVVHGEHLRGWLKEQPVKIVPDAVPGVAAAIVAVRPSEHRRWWERLSELGVTGRGAVASVSANADAVHGSSETRRNETDTVPGAA
jgi:Nuclease-related domain